jgi:hypothetical protein
MGARSTAEFLSYLRSQEVKLWIEGEKLRCRVPEEAATPELRDSDSSCAAAWGHASFLCPATDVVR